MVDLKAAALSAVPRFAKAGAQAEGPSQQEEVWWRIKSLVRKDSKKAGLEAAAAEVQPENDAVAPPETTRQLIDRTASRIRWESGNDAGMQLQSRDDAAVSGTADGAALLSSARQASRHGRSPAPEGERGSATGTDSSSGSVGGWQSLRQRFPLRRAPGSAVRKVPAALAPEAVPTPVAAPPAQPLPALPDGYAAASRRTTQQQEGQPLQHAHSLPPCQHAQGASAAGAAGAAAAALSSRLARLPSLDSSAGPPAGRSQSLVLPPSRPASRKRTLRGTDGSEAARPLLALPPAVVHLPRLPTASSWHSLREEAPALRAPSRACSLAAAPSRAGSCTAAPARSQPSHLRPAAPQLAAARAELAEMHQQAAAQAEQLAREARELGRLHLKLTGLQDELAEVRERRQAAMTRLALARSELAQQRAAQTARLAALERQLSAITGAAEDALCHARIRLQAALHQEAAAEEGLEAAEAAGEEWRARHNRMLCEHRPRKSAALGDTWWESRAPFWHNIETSLAPLAYRPRHPAAKRHFHQA